MSSWLNISNKASDMCIKLMSEFGMSPSSRTKLTIIRNADKQLDAFESWMDEGKTGEQPNRSTQYQA